MDDFLAVCVGLHFCPLVDFVHRRDPALGELQAPEVLVLDVGMRYEPELRNFDHHQLKGECALSLFAAAVKVHGVPLSDVFSHYPWYENLRVGDSEGPVALATMHGVSVKTLHALRSPLDRMLLTLFQAGVLETGMLRALGTGLVEGALTDALAYLAIDYATKPLLLGGVPGILVNSTSVAGLRHWRERHVPDAAFSISRDDRGPGWALFRFDDDPRVDFTRIKDDHNVTFCHNNGFIAKTADVSLQLVEQLVTEALVLP
jgi:hypothetical protein